MPRPGVKLAIDPAFWLPSGNRRGSYSYPFHPMALLADQPPGTPDIADTPWLVLTLAILVAFSIYLILRSKRK